jgi:capsule polysaccharide export protein KpsC/LpsZ
LKNTMLSGIREPLNTAMCRSAIWQGFDGAMGCDTRPAIPIDPTRCAGRPFKQLMILSTTKTIAELPHLATFLADTPHAVAGWGRKPSGRRAIWLARMLHRRLALLEDGFVRSVERHAPPVSLLVDDLGVYYDARRPSRMERSISQGTNANQASRARALAAQWRAGGISKYNHAPDYGGPLPENYVLVVDQTFGDLSVSGGLANASSFPTMLAAALDENPQHAIVVKVHPDVHSGAKQGYFPSRPLQNRRVQTIGVDCHGASLIRGARSVYCVTSLMGFEALLWEKQVRCFGMPFYAGWGLTQDELRPPSRRHRAALDDVVHAALVDVARYADPIDGGAWTVEEAIDHIVRGRAALLAGRQPPVPA